MAIRFVQCLKEPGQFLWLQETLTLRFLEWLDLGHRIWPAVTPLDRLLEQNVQNRPNLIRHLFPSGLANPGVVDERLLRRVLYGLSCRNYEAAAEAFPGAIGLSASTVSRQFIEATAKQLRQFQERDLSELDLVGLWLDGKTFAEDTMVIALGLTLEGRKVPLGFVQAGTENTGVLGAFLQELLGRGLKSEAGLRVILDGGKGLRVAVKQAFRKRALVQRCQWHKRENVVKYLPKGEQGSMRRRLQRAYQKPTYREARAELDRILEELRGRNLSAARSLEEGLEETLKSPWISQGQSVGPESCRKSASCHSPRLYDHPERRIDEEKVQRRSESL